MWYHTCAEYSVVQILFGPYRGAPEVYVEVSVGVLHTHNTVFLDLQYMLYGTAQYITVQYLRPGVVEGVRAGPDIVDPAELPRHQGRGEHLQGPVETGAPQCGLPLSAGCWSPPG